MHNYFPNRRLKTQKIKVNKKISDAIEKYRESFIPLKNLLTDVSIVKKLNLDEIINPWAYYHGGIERYDVESGISAGETALLFAAMGLKNEKPTNIINAAFYSNNSRNDSTFEISYLAPQFLDMVGDDERILIINPSPDLVLYFENNFKGEKHYAVTDDTVAMLYSSEFPESQFVSFANVDSLFDIDAALLANRDQKTEDCNNLINCLRVCNNNARLLALVPSSWFDKKQTGAYKSISSFGFAMREMLIVDTKATVSSPRKKVLIMMNKGAYANTFNLYSSEYRLKEREFLVEEHKKEIDCDKYFFSDKTILSLWKNEGDYVRKSSSYKKAEEYKFSKEISLFYKIYEKRKNSFAGVVNYRKLVDVEKGLFGKVISKNVEKGLRAKTIEGVIESLETVPFNDLLYPIIKCDIEEKFINQRRSVSLKTIWFYFAEELNRSKDYNNSLMKELFKDPKIADFEPAADSINNLLISIAKNRGVEMEDITFSLIKQLNFLFSLACKHGMLYDNPVIALVSRYTKRTSARQNEVRNALVTKHFSKEEEKVIFDEIIKEEEKNGSKHSRCTLDSIWLAPAIRMFTGMAIREVAALNWADFVKIESVDEYQLRITKFVDSKGTIVSHAQRENRKRFRVIPVCQVLKELLNARKEYLLNLGISEEYLKTCPIILGEEKIKEMISLKKIKHCKPEKVSQISNKLIKKAQIPENILILPDDRNELETDFGRYHGDIFLSNFRYKVKQEAKMTNGEIHYIIGINAPDTFSKHYCDYTNDLVQYTMIQKMNRWAFPYYMGFTKKRYAMPKFGVETGSVKLKVGPFKDGVASVDLFVEVKEKEEIKVNVFCEHGFKYNIEQY